MRTKAAAPSETADRDANGLAPPARSDALRADELDEGVRVRLTLVVLYLDDLERVAEARTL